MPVGGHQGRTYGRPMPPSRNIQNTYRRVRALVVASAVACSLTLGAVHAEAAEAARCPGASAMPDEAGTQALAHTTLCLINNERTQRGIPPLHLNARLSRAAAGHSSDMVQRHYFSHTSLSGATFADRIRATGYLGSARSWIIGENLDWGTKHWSSPAGAVEAWMHSPPHRENILRRSFREIGIGVVVGGPRDLGRPVATYTTDFGAKGQQLARRRVR